MSSTLLNNTAILGRLSCRFSSIPHQSLNLSNRSLSSKVGTLPNYSSLRKLRISQVPPATFRKPTSILHSLNLSRQNALRRTFHTETSKLIRQTYFPKGSNGRPPPSSSSGWFRSLRRRIDRLPIMTVIYGLIGLNIGIFLLWQYAMTSYQRFRDPSWLQFLHNNFVLNEGNIMAGRIWTLLTACFSHSTGSHIMVNCLGLYFVAPAAASLIGSSAFLGLYLGGGMFASLLSLGWHRMRRDRWAGSEGASGAIYASLAFYAAMFPNSTFLLFFIVPLPAWALVGGIFAWDAYGAVVRPGSGTDSVGHVGGILAGLIAAGLTRRRMGGGRFGRF